MSASDGKAQLQCGAPPVLPASEDAESTRINLENEADFLSKLVGTPELLGQINSVRESIFHNGSRTAALQKDSYLFFLFCTLVAQDASIGESAKQVAIDSYRNSTLSSSRQLSPAARDCEALAASPDDPSRPADVQGVSFDSIDPERAVAACRAAVSTDPSPRLQYALARSLDAGHQSPAEITRLYRLAADQGYAPAQSNLAQLYEKGTGVDKSFEEAARLYQLAADQGFAPAQFRLAVLADQGLGGLHFADTEIVRLLKLASDQGFAPAEGGLGFMFEQGRGVPQSYSEAIRLYRLAAAKGNSAAQKRLDALKSSGHNG